MAIPLCNTEDFGTACVKLVSNFRHLCIVNFKIDTLISKSVDISCFIHALSTCYQTGRREARKLTTLIRLGNVWEPVKTMMGKAIIQIPSIDKESRREKPIKINPSLRDQKRLYLSHRTLEKQVLLSQISEGENVELQYHLLG